MCVLVWRNLESRNLIFWYILTASQFTPLGSTSSQIINQEFRLEALFLAVRVAQLKLPALDMHCTPD